MSDLPRNQHIIASGVIATIGLTVAYISFTQEPAAAFLFPRLISSVFAVLAICQAGVVTNTGIAIVLCVVGVVLLLLFFKQDADSENRILPR